jgi:hypothetical protein
MLHFSRPFPRLSPALSPALSLFLDGRASCSENMFDSASAPNTSISFLLIHPQQPPIDDPPCLVLIYNDNVHTRRMSFLYAGVRVRERGVLRDFQSATPRQPQVCDAHEGTVCVYSEPDQRQKVSVGMQVAGGAAVLQRCCAAAEDGARLCLLPPALPWLCYLSLAVLSVDRR